MSSYAMLEFLTNSDYSCWRRGVLSHGIPWTLARPRRTIPKTNSVARCRDKVQREDSRKINRSDVENVLRGLRKGRYTKRRTVGTSSDAGGQKSDESSQGTLEINSGRTCSRHTILARRRERVAWVQRMQVNASAMHKGCKVPPAERWPGAPRRLGWSQEASRRSVKLHLPFSFLLSRPSFESNPLR